LLSTNAWLRFDAIRRGMRTAQPQTVLEIGAGEGGLAVWMARRHDYTGIEPDAASRVRTRARLATVGRGRVVEDLSYVGDQQFDLVCAFEVLEHIADDVSALEAWRDSIQPRGWLLLSVPAHADQYGPHDELAGHYRRYERSDLAKRLESAGFDVVRTRSCGAGLGFVLQHFRDALARRGASDRSIEERTSASGRYLQPHAAITGLACAAIAAPFRLAQLPFAGTDIGTGYVVLARRSG
jgi:cyclopropane fatty-acyl-phospholipid synthase-like methyltransferase